jgi:hypothetical protein
MPNEFDKQLIAFWDKIEGSFRTQCQYYLITNIFKYNDLFRRMNTWSFSVGDLGEDIVKGDPYDIARRDNHNFPLI